MMTANGRRRTSLTLTGPPPSPPLPTATAIPTDGCDIGRRSTGHEFFFFFPYFFFVKSVSWVGSSHGGNASREGKGGQGDYKAPVRPYTAMEQDLARYLTHKLCAHRTSASCTMSHADTRVASFLF